MIIDSNIFIHAESFFSDGSQDPQDVAAGSLIADLVNLAFVPSLSHGTTTDIDRASAEVRGKRKRQASRFETLERIPIPPGLAERAGFPNPRSVNDEADLQVLAALDVGVGQYLVTNDKKLLARASRAGFSETAMNLTEAIDWVHSLRSVPVRLPRLEETRAYQVPLSQPIFEPLHRDYPKFDAWWKERVCPEKRTALIIGDAHSLEALAVLKPEDSAYGIDSWLKVCTFVVSEAHASSRRGELLLNGVVRYARRSGHQRIYMEVLPDKVRFIEWLRLFGFAEIGRVPEDGGIALGKSLEPEQGASPLPPLEHAKAYGPGSVRIDRAFVVPIQPRWHKVLFPDAEAQTALSLDTDPSCGLAIRKAYLCHSALSTIIPGDFLLFMRTQEQPSSIRATGVVDNVVRSGQPQEIIDFVGERTVYTSTEIREMCDRREVLAIRFRLDRILDAPIPQSTVIAEGALRAAPQTITSVKPKGLEWIRRTIGAWP